MAQYGRASGLIQDVASQLIGQFANCLKAQLAASGATSNAAKAPQAQAAAKPISGLALMWSVLLNAIRRLFGR